MVDDEKSAANKTRVLRVEYRREDQYLSIEIQPYGGIVGSPLHDIAMHNIVWCMAYKWGSEAGSNIAQWYCNSIATVWAMQVEGAMKG